MDDTSKEPLLSNESWDEVSISLNSLSNDPPNGKGQGDLKSVVKLTGRAASLASSAGRSLIAWSDSDDPTANRLISPMIAPNPSKKRCGRFKRLPRPQFGSGTIKSGTGSGLSNDRRPNNHSHHHNSTGRRCTRDPHDMQQTCARWSLHGLLLLVALFLCAFVFNVNQQLQQMQLQVTDGKPRLLLISLRISLSPFAVRQRSSSTKMVRPVESTCTLSSHVFRQTVPIIFEH
jgi:hypothetical protein